MKFLATTFNIFLAIEAGSQVENLVLNPGFEKNKTNQLPPVCAYATNNKAFDASVLDWNTFRGMTPDIINWKPDAYGDCFFPKPHSGEKAAGIITYHPKTDTGRHFDFHEFIQGKLKFPLVPGLTYEISIYIQQSDSIAINHLKTVYGEKQEIVPTAAGNLGILFSNNPMDYIPTTDDAMVPDVVFQEPIYTKHGEWKLLKKTFTPDRPFLYFTIGNFSSDNNTPNLLDNNFEIEEFNLAQTGFAQKKKRIAYYCLDDFRIAPQKANDLKLTSDLKTKKSYTFRNVNFETGKWDLLPEAFAELDALVVFLAENQNLKVLIAGHTDDVGDDNSNLVLSKKRAETVCNYLISSGIEKNRLIFKGFGETKTLKPNDSSENRSLNRPVECKIL